MNGYIKRCPNFNPKEVYFEKVVDNKLILTTPTQYIRHRGDTLVASFNNRNLNPYDEVIRVRTYHFKGVQDGKVDFELNLPERRLDYESTSEEIVVRRDRSN